MANACGPCIGQWSRKMDNPDRKNSILNSFNRNFAKRNDGNPNTHSFIASPEIVTALTLAGTLTFNPLKDPLINENGEKVMLDEPVGVELPPKGFDVKDPGFIPPPADSANIAVIVDPKSDRLQLLEPFDRLGRKGSHRDEASDQGKREMYHRSYLHGRPMAEIPRSSRQYLQQPPDGSAEFYNEKTNSVKNVETGEYGEVSKTARYYKAHGVPTIIIGDENYGEGSCREHAAMEPRHLGVRAVLVKSFARIHETNLKKQGMLAVTFTNPEDYNKILEDDSLDITGLNDFAPGKPLTMVLHHADGTKETISLNHSYSDLQIKWFKAGSALNFMKQTT